MRQEDIWIPDTLDVLSSIPLGENKEGGDK